MLFPTHACSSKLINLASIFLDGYPLTGALLDNCNPICCSCMTLAPVLEERKLEGEAPSGSPPARQPVQLERTSLNVHNLPGGKDVLFIFPNDKISTLIIIKQSSVQWEVI